MPTYIYIIIIIIIYIYVYIGRHPKPKRGCPQPLHAVGLELLNIKPEIMSKMALSVLHCARMVCLVRINIGSP